MVSEQITQIHVKMFGGRNRQSPNQRISGKLINVPCFARLSELADETDSKSVAFMGVWVRFPHLAPRHHSSIW